MHNASGAHDALKW